MSTEPSGPIDRLPPNNPEAEEAVLGSCLMDPEAIHKVRGDLEAGDFYRSRNGAIYQALLALVVRGMPTDFVTLTDELKSQGRFDEIGGLPYLSRLVGVVPTAVHVEHYAGIVRRTAIKRRLISAAGKIAAVAYDETLDLETSLAMAQELLAGVDKSAGGLDLYSPEEQALIAVTLVEKLGSGIPTGIPTGLHDLDRVSGGLRDGCLYILGAMTGVGKTSWMHTIARTVAAGGKRVLFASSEMTVTELVKRSLAALSGRDWNHLERELACPADYPETQTDMARRIFELSEHGFHVYHGGSMTVDKIRRRAAKMTSTGGCDVIFVDYLQRLRDAPRRGADRFEQVQFIAQSLKGMAVDLNVPVVVAAQFGRKVLERRDKSPMLSDFRESGDIEHEADVALGLHRPHYFDDKANPGEAWLHLLKNRHGVAEIKFQLTWLPATCSYVSAYAGEIPF